jgi:hypothetical protein
MEDMSKSKLLAAIHAGHDTFKSLLAEFTEEQLLQPGVVGEWSIKDILAHIVVHEERMIQWVTEMLLGHPPETSQPYGMPEDELTIVNQIIYQENRDRCLSNVLSALEDAHVHSLAMVAGAREGDLTGGGCFKLKDGEPVWEAIAANTFWHYEEHGRDISKWRNIQ